MRIRLLTLSVLTIAFLISCESHFYHMYLLTNNATGVTSGSAIKIRGMKIGKVTSLALFSNEYILINLEIDKKYRLPKSSTLTIEPSDFIGNKFISVKLGNTNSYLTDADTVYETKDMDGVQDFRKNGIISPDSVVKAIKIEKEKIKENIMQ